MNTTIAYWLTQSTLSNKYLQSTAPRELLDDYSEYKAKWMRENNSEVFTRYLDSREYDCWHEFLIKRKQQLIEEMTK